MAIATVFVLAMIVGIASLAAKSTPSAVRPSGTGATGACATPPPMITPIGSFKYSVEVDTSTAWRPVGGEVVVRLKGQNNAPVSGLSVQTCFAKKDWGDNRPFVAGGPIRIDSSNEQQVEFRTAIPDLDKYEPDEGITWWQKHIVRRWNSFVEEGSVVPISYVRVIATNASKAPKEPANGAAASEVAAGANASAGTIDSAQANGSNGDNRPPQVTDPAATVDVLLPIGVTSVTSASLSTILIVICALIILRVFVVEKYGPNASFLLSIIAGKNGAASLSQFQMVLWTFVVGASAIYVILLSGNLINISGEVLALLGISGVTFLGAQLQSDPKQPPGPSANPPAANAGGARAGDPAAAAAAAVAGGGAGSNTGGVLAKPRSPKWFDLVAGTDGSGIDVSRVQMFFFTIVSAIFVILKVFGNYAIPDLPSGYLALMGISNGVYLANKFVPESSAKGN